MELSEVTNTKGWSSIDILIFSNGQQYSPPRKYHLCSEELQWWGETMSFLGRTHYGSGHSTIELYAIDGTKINGPLELINGAAYVAVEPPDSFINTGYEEYLVRASRSWEKRSTQKPYNTETLKPDLKRNKDPVVQSNVDEVITREDIDDKAPLNASSNALVPPQKTRSIKPYQRPQRKSIANSKQIQKKKSFDTHSSMLKRICAETDKVYPCPKKLPVKKNGCLNQKSSSIAPRKASDEINQERSCCKKRGFIKPEPNSKTDSKALNLSDTAPVREPQIIDLFKNDESDLMSIQNPERYSIVDKSTFHRSENNITEDEVFEDKPSAIIDNGQYFERNSSDKSRKVEEKRQSVNFPNNSINENEMEMHHEGNIPIINNDNRSKSYDTVLNNTSEKQVTDEYVAQMNKGGLLRLKLKVKLKDCKTIFNRDKSKNVPTTNSLSNLPKTEKTSQVDINISFSGELLKSKHNQDKSLQSLLNKLYTGEIGQKSNNDPRIIILQCACRNYSDNHKVCECDTYCNGCEDLNKNQEEMLNRKLNETFTSCECQIDSIKTSRDEYAIKTQSATYTDEDRPTLHYSNGTRVKDLAQKFESSGLIIGNNKNNSNNEQNSKDMTANEKKRQSVVLTRLNVPRVLERDAENLIEEESYSKIVCNKFTQTDWCNVLLEARLHGDDNYTFHLPSLYILKQYNL